MKKILKNQRPEKTAAKKKPLSIKKLVLISCMFLFLSGLFLSSLGAAFLYFHYSKDLPDVRALKDYQPSTITKLYSDTDELIAEFYIEKRIIIAQEDIPLQLKQATLAVEDSNFYSHFGMDPKAIFRAMITNFKAGHVVEGGSTITQQLSKTLFLTRDRTLTRKIKEAILAIRMELIFSKDEILEMYLNQIYYGHGSYGVEAAARTYFGKKAHDLSVEECAMLASLPKAPNNYSPYRYPERARKRRSHALRRMEHLGFISHEESERAQKENFKLGEITDMLNKAPYFVEHIRQFLEDTYGSTKLYRGGLKVYTTLNLDFQEVAQQAVTDNLRVADKRYGYRGPLGKVDLTLNPLTRRETLLELNGFEGDDHPGVESGTIIKGAVLEVTDDDVLVELGKDEGIIELKDMQWARKPNINVDGRWAKIARAREALSPGDLILVKVLGRRDQDMRWSLSLEQEPQVEAGLVSLEPGTGHIKAMVGGYDFSKSQFNRAVQATRQPGSAFKPIIYASAIAAGYDPASIIIDSPIIFKEKEDAFDKWKPVNFEKKFYGPTSLRTALTHSRNIVTVKLLQNIGVDSAIQMARNLGITTHLADNLSIALGSSGVTLLEITSAYSTFANGGERVFPTAVRVIENRDGELLYSAQPHVSQPISSGLAYTITSLMQSVVQHGTAKKVKVLNRPVAGKTGTTNNNVDAWFIGFLPGVVTGVWVGKDNYEPLGVNETGSRAAIPIWLQYMKHVVQGEPVMNFPVSNEIVFTKTNRETGEKANFGDPDARFEVFIDDNVPELDTESIDPLKENTF
ncbi:MAG: penicillin-binding protein 1A [Nitrospinaceae bacterium]|nr:MAG: penicillin-binding protein 1A [Nitrospinaceae bacterium]